MNEKNGGSKVADIEIDPGSSIESLGDLFPEEVIPSAEAEAMISAEVVKGVCSLIGDTVARITKYDEMNFTESEKEELAKVWSPLMPGVSPLTAALVTTLVIVGSKTSLFIMLRKEEKGVRKEA